MASTSASNPDITFYVFGRLVPSGTLSDGLRDVAFSALQETFTNLVPTTYEAAKAYLDRELLKPEGQRDLLREMCMLIVLKIPNDQDLALIAETPKMLISIKEGMVLFYPTIELPPSSFGVPGNPQGGKLLDQKTDKLGAATIVLAYFTKVGDEIEHIGDAADTETIQLPYSPFK